jgi:hypothetical protein
MEMKEYLASKYFLGRMSGISDKKSSQTVIAVLNNLQQIPYPAIQHRHNPPRQIQRQRRCCLRVVSRSCQSGDGGR